MTLTDFNIIIRDQVSGSRPSGPLDLVVKGLYILLMALFSIEFQYGTDRPKALKCYSIYNIDMLF